PSFRGSGTSFSTAVASGAAALIVQRTPSVTPDGVKARLRRTAIPLTPHDVDVDGKGSIDAYSAAHSTITGNQGAIVRSIGDAPLIADCGTVCDSGSPQVHTNGILALGGSVPIDLTD